MVPQSRLLPLRAPRSSFRLATRAAARAMHWHVSAIEGPALPAREQPAALWPAASADGFPPIVVRFSYFWELSMEVINVSTLVLATLLIGVSLVSWHAVDRPKELGLGSYHCEENITFRPAGLHIGSVACPRPASVSGLRARREQNLQQTIAGLARASQQPTTCRVHRCGRVSALDVSFACLTPTYDLQVAAYPGESALERVAILDQDWGWPGYERRLRLNVVSVNFSEHGELRAPWLAGRWHLVAPPYHFGVNNLHHELTGTMHYLEERLGCAGVGAQDASYLFMHDEELLKPRGVGSQIFNLATDSAALYYWPLVEDAAAGEIPLVCFERVVVELNVHEGIAALEPYCAAHTPVPPERTSTTGRSAPPASALVPAGAPQDAHGLTPESLVAIMARRARERQALPPTPLRHVGPAMPRPAITIIHRLRTRRLLNLDHLLRALRRVDLGDVTVVALECLRLEQQVAIATESSSLVGVHGAGMMLAKFLPRDGAQIELRSAPCTNRDHNFQKRRPSFAVVPAPWNSVLEGPVAGQRRRDDRPPRSPDDVGRNTSLRCPLWRANDPSDVVVDIPAVIATIERLDPVLRYRRRTHERRVAGPTDFPRRRQ